MISARMLPFLALLILAPQLPAETRVGYPQNPLSHDGALFVSRQGVYRFTPDRAEPVWRALADVETFAPVAHGDRLLVGSSRGLYALETASGEIAWHIETARTLFSPSIAGAAYAGSVHGELYAIDPDDGSIAWRRAFPGWIYSPAFGDDPEILWTGGQAHSVHALSARDGSTLHEIGTPQEAVFSPVDIGGDRVAFNLFDGSTLVVQASRGEILTSLGGESQPLRLHRRDGMLLRTHRDGRLFAYDADTLRPLWRIRLADRDLTLHPSPPGKLFLSNRERDFVLLNPNAPERPCHFHAVEPAALALQTETDSIVLFRNRMKPTGISLVTISVPCK